MKKILLIAGIPVAVLIFIAYCWLTPVITVSVGRSSNPETESYINCPMVSYSEKLGIPMPSFIKERIVDFTESNTDVFMSLHDNYNQPIRVDSKVELTDKQTIVTYKGTVTDSDGIEQPYEKQLVFDYIITKDIR